MNHSEGLGFHAPSRSAIECQLPLGKKATLGEAAVFRLGWIPEKLQRAVATYYLSSWSRKRNISASVPKGVGGRAPNLGGIQSMHCLFYKI